ncbi:DUF3159 domain-containing protein [Gordonia sp. TBRC 11910]|uniref:DUF3159 domain-containing protein n=1 Tax=Gordonia asplenii TaxID=2725283 RepID=A0A848L1H2_9ACTN|nr:DUF3159 domain-containing protein [Gordonia asplenii]NMO04860.1 DUF3159 domain-containing protein [Gordonia asplenii]
MTCDAAQGRTDSGRKRLTAWEQIGGLPGLIGSAAPSLAFVSVHAYAGMVVGIVVAGTLALLIVIVRAARGRSLRPAVGGVVGVVVSSAIALRTGDARDYFLPDIWVYAVCAVVTTLSIVVRWPLAGVLWSAVNATSMRWRDDRRALISYSVASATAAVVFVIRTVTQIWFYRHDQAGAMALMRIVLNYPLWAIIVLVWVWAIRRVERSA